MGRAILAYSRPVALVQQPIMKRLANMLVSADPESGEPGLSVFVRAKRKPIRRYVQFEDPFLEKLKKVLSEAALAPVPGKQ